jgi:hypothetical protein
MARYAADDFQDSWVVNARDNAIDEDTDHARDLEKRVRAVADAMYDLAEAWRLLDEISDS